MTKEPAWLIKQETENKLRELNDIRKRNKVMIYVGIFFACFNFIIYSLSDILIGRILSLFACILLLYLTHKTILSNNNIEQILIMGEELLEMIKKRDG